MIEYVFMGLVGMENRDLGDGLQKTTLVETLQLRHGKIKAWLYPSVCETSPGIWVRSPYGNGWETNEDTTSRDQIMSMVIWAGYADEPEILKRQLVQQVKRFGFYQNKLEIWNNKEKPWYKVDFASPEHWGQYVRSFAMIEAREHIGILGQVKRELLRNILTFTDLFMLGNVIITNVMGYYNPDYSDDDNMVLSMIQSYDSLDTITAKLSRMLYKLRPTAGYTDETKTVSLRQMGIKDVWSAIRWKHRKATGAPPIAELFDEFRVQERF